MTRWLSEDEQRSWRAFLEAMRLLQAGLDAQLQRDADMPHAYYEILVRLSDVPERRMRMRELAEATRSSRSRLTHAVDKLEARGWVSRQECPHDRRGQLAVLTEEGFRVLAAAAPGHVEAVRATLLDALTPAQVAQLGRISEAVVAHAAPHTGSC